MPEEIVEFVFEGTSGESAFGAGEFEDGRHGRRLR